MGYAVVHMMKIGKGAVRGIQSHNQREKDPHTNPDIDKARTKDNYELLGSRLNYHREINERIAQYATGTKTVRKDAVVLCNFIITSDEKTMKAMSPQMQRDFFTDSVKFFSERYGSENLVNATVHMDETTPHLHIGLVPITGDGRLSAKSIFTKTELRNLQTDFAQQVGERYGLERGIEGSERTHLSEQQFKTQKAVEQEQEARKGLLKAQKELEGIKHSLPPLKAEYEAFKAFLDQSAKDSQISVMYPDYVKVSDKGLVKKEKYVTVPADKWEERHVSANQMQAVLRSRESVEQSIEDIKNSDLSAENEQLKAQNAKLEKEVRRLQSDLNVAMRDIRQIKQFFSNNPDVQQSFAEERAAMQLHPDAAPGAVLKDL